MEIVAFKDWIFASNKQSNLQAYSGFDSSGADRCNCKHCENYMAQRSNVFPDEVRELFLNLGIDYRKDAEVTTYYRLENGLYHTVGWFHFKGQMLAGKSCAVPHPDGNGYTFQFNRIAENFSIGFSASNDLAMFADKNDLVQIHFETTIPWVIEGPAPEC